MKLSTILFVVGLLFFGTNITHAHYPSVTLDYIDGTPVSPYGVSLDITFFPYTLDLEGTVSHEGEKNLKDIVLFATINGELIYGPEPLNGRGNNTTTHYTIPWTIESYGIYQIAITALHRDDSIYSSTDKNCKAATAITAAYLKETGQSNKSNDSNTISEVAKETGKNGTLAAQDKCQTGYKTEAISFTLDLLNQQ